MNKYLIHYLNPTTDNEERAMKFKFKFKLNARLLTLVMILALALFAFLKSDLFSQEPIYIALVHSMDKHFRAEGEAMRRGAQLYIDAINQAGGVNGKPVKLLVYNDQGDEQKAKQIALEIAKQNQALVVLGHLFSNACLKAGQVYQQAGIPAITPSCMADAVTAGNDWYFGVVPDNQFQGVFLANYVKKILKHNTVSIVYDDQNDYSRSLVKGFENPFRGLNGKIKQKWTLNGKEDKANIENIAKAFLRENPGLIFLALSNKEAKQLIVSMKREGLQYPIIGADALGQNSFAASFSEYPEEKAQPGYFTDGIYATAPLIWDIAGEYAQKGRHEYIRKYQQEPSWIVAMAYDAAHLAISAIQQTGIQGLPETLTEERQKIRDYLASLTSMEKAVTGLNDSFYFDQHGNAVKPLAVGVFKKQQFISALTQFRPISDIKQIGNLKAELVAERIVTIAGQYMYKTNIVYTGIDFNEISQLDIKNSTYHLDFYLWFRSQKGVDASNIEFQNAVDSFQKLKSDKAIIEESAALGNLIEDSGEEVSYKAYRVKADFKGQFYFRDYPFDTQQLAVRFSHTQLTHHNIIYVVDFVGLEKTDAQSILNKLKRNHVLTSINDWHVKTAHFFQDIVNNESTLGYPKFFGTDSHHEYSQFNAVIEIKRNVLSFITKNLLPLLFLVGISYLILFLPVGEISVTAVSGTLLAVAFFHLSLANGLPEGIGYAVALDYAFYVIYGLIIFQLFLIVIGQHKAIKENEVMLKRVVITGRTVYPLVLLIAMMSAVYIYGDISSFFESSPTTVADAAGPTHEALRNESKDDEVILTFGSWWGQSAEGVNRFLAAFNAQYPNITLKVQPSIDEYESIIQFQLKNSIAPDFFSLPPFRRSWFKAGYVEPLGDLPGLTQNFSQAARTPWATDEGEPYAVPFMADYHAIYYNVDLFNKLGLEVPTTWEALLTTAQAIKQAGYISFANGLKTDWATAELFMNLAPNFIGGREGRLEYLSGQRCFNDEHAVAAFQAVADMAPFLPDTPETLSYQASKQLFLQGKAAMFLGSSIEIAHFESEKSDFKWRVFAIPAPVGKYEYLMYHPKIAIGLNAASKHKKEAKLFLAWLTQPETAELFSNELPGHFPLHQKAPTLDNEHAKAFLDLKTERGTDIQWASEKLRAGLPDGQSLMLENTLAVIKGEKTPQEAANALQEGLAGWFEPAQRCFIQ
jgi:branched-chain amino acid transport system substrate-binding protein